MHCARFIDLSIIQSSSKVVISIMTDSQTASPHSPSPGKRLFTLLNLERNDLWVAVILSLAISIIVSSISRGGTSAAARVRSPGVRIGAQFVERPHRCAARSEWARGGESLP